jgi:fructose-1-phosphate kinase PfkB-like protein
LVRAAAPTRRTFCFLDADGAQPVLVVEDGAKVTPREVAAFGVRVERELTRTDVLVLSGSVPPGMKPAVYAHWIRSARAHGIPSVVDAHGEALRAAITAVPTVIVPNEREFAQWLGLALFDGIDDRTLIDGARPLLERGMLAVVVKQGERGLLCIERERTTRVCGLPRLGNATGSGDVVTAHVAVALARGWPILVALPRAVAAAGANLAHEQPGITASGRSWSCWGWSKCRGAEETMRDARHEPEAGALRFPSSGRAASRRTSRGSNPGTPSNPGLDSSRG